MINHEQAARERLIRERENEDILNRYCKALKDHDSGMPLLEALQKHDIVQVNRS